MIRYKKKVARYAVALLTICSVVQLLGAGTSYADEASTRKNIADETRTRKKFKDKILVVQPKPILQRNRVEIIPVFRASLNDTIVTNYSVGAVLNFHILEYLYIGGGFDWANFGNAFGGFSSLAKAIDRDVAATPDGAKQNYFAYGHIGYVPVMGKFAIFNSAIGYYDLAITAGAGWMDYTPISRNNADRGTVAGVIGVNTRLFIADWAAIHFSLRDAIFLADLAPVLKKGAAKPKKGKSQKYLTNIVSAGVGLSIYIPFGFKYSQTDLSGEGSLNVANEE